jgi:myo-inositol-1-phosphate synthase
MIKRVKVAVVGVGNNISALVQGIALHRATGSLVGIHRPVLDGLTVADIDFVAAFATSPEKIGKDLTEAIFLPPNNFPRLTSALPITGVTVRRGLTDVTEAQRVAEVLVGAQVVLDAAPSGRQETARAAAALQAGPRSSTPPPMRWPGISGGWRFSAAGLPLPGDDLTSQFGTSVVHHALLRRSEQPGRGSSPPSTNRSSGPAGVNRNSVFAAWPVMFLKRCPQWRGTNTKSAPV